MTSPAVVIPRPAFAQIFTKPAAAEGFRGWDMPLYAFIASIPFETFGSEHGEGVDVSIARVLGLLWAFCTVLDPMVKLRRNSRDLVAMTLLIVIHFGRSMAVAPELWDMANHITLVLIQMALMIWLLAGSISQRPYLYEHIAWVYAVSCGTVALLQLVGVTDSMVQGSQRVTAMGEDPNTWCGKLAVGLVLAVGLAWRRKRLSPVVIIAAGFVCATTIPTILVSGSRGGLAALLVGMMVLAFSAFLAGKGVNRFRKVVLMMAVLGLLIYGIASSEIMTQRWEQAFDNGNLATREVVYPQVVGMVLAKPLVGWGPIEDKVEMCAAIGLCQGLRSTESTLAWALTSMGILGAAPLFYILFLAVRAAWRLRLTVLGWTPIAAMCTTLTFSCTVEWHHVKVYWLIIGITIAAGSAHANRNTTRHRLPQIELHPAGEEA